MGVKRQCSGHRGKVDNCQVGVFMGYVSRHDHALLDFRLSLPKDWHGTSHDARHATCRRKYAIKHGEQCLEMLDMWRDQVPHGWVTADDELGRHTQFPAGAIPTGAQYVLGVPCTTTVGDLEVPLLRVSGLDDRRKPPGNRCVPATIAPSDAWTRLTVCDGEKGPVGLRWSDAAERTSRGNARDPRSGWWSPVVPSRMTACWRGKLAGCHGARRPLSLPVLPHVSVSPRRREKAPTGGGGGVITAGLCIEASFKRGKSEAGMDEYQVRTWQGWHHHMALSLLAVWFLIGRPTGASR